MPLSIPNVILHLLGYGSHAIGVLYLTLQTRFWHVSKEKQLGRKAP